MSNPNPKTLAANLGLPPPLKIKKFFVHDDGRNYPAPRSGDDGVGPAKPGFRLATDAEAGRIAAGLPHATPAPTPISTPAKPGK